MDPIQQTLDQVLAEALVLLPKLLSALVVFIVSLLLSTWLARAVRQGAENRETKPELTLLLHRLTRWSVLILGTLLALEQVDFDVTSLIAGLGIVGVTIGFALQDVAKNFVAGVLLLLQQPFTIGDVIEVKGFVGTVLEISLRTTDMRILDGRIVTIPNGDIFINPILNYSRAPRRRIEIVGGVSYDSDLSHVAQVAYDTIQDVPLVLEDPEPEITFREFGGSAVEFVLYFWLDTSGPGLKETNVRQAKDAGIQAVKLAFEREGIEMPFPTTAIRMDTPVQTLPASQEKTS